MYALQSCNEHDGDILIQTTNILRIAKLFIELLYSSELAM